MSTGKRSCQHILNLAAIECSDNPLQHLRCAHGRAIGSGAGKNAKRNSSRVTRLRPVRVLPSNSLFRQLPREFAHFECQRYPLLPRHSPKHLVLNYSCGRTRIHLNHGRISALSFIHLSVCTSTLSTAGRFCTMALQLSPASFEQYTWPPLVPKYTPHLSRVSTAMASRRTFT